MKRSVAQQNNSTDSIKTHTVKWLRICLINLAIVALIGVLMRYKILYSFPWLDQKNLLHAHSHFAFGGWATQALIVLIINRISIATGRDLFSSYKIPLYGNLIASYGMLCSFPFQGYGLVSISFSTLSLLIGFYFGIKLWLDLNRFAQRQLSSLWWKASIVFYFISSVGTGFLTYMMATKTASADNYLAAVYFYLHFQYNGWFFFACMGIFAPLIIDPIQKVSRHQLIFWLFAAACIPAYFLSALWLPMPLWVYVLVVFSALAQLIAWIYLILPAWKERKELKMNKPSPFWWLMGLAAVALSIKLLLQLGSTIPALSKLAFGFRPIVIGYLHLALLAVISLSILGFCFIEKLFTNTGASKFGLLIFTVGIGLNEIFLGVQGAAAIGYLPIPYINEMLLAASLILLLGGITMLMGNLKSNNPAYEIPSSN